jgi:hypothetical protein
MQKASGSRRANAAAPRTNNIKAFYFDDAEMSTPGITHVAFAFSNFPTFWTNPVAEFFAQATPKFYHDFSLAATNILNSFFPHRAPPCYYATCAAKYFFPHDLSTFTLIDCA